MVWIFVARLSASPPFKWVVPCWDHPTKSNREVGGYITYLLSSRKRQSAFKWTALLVLPTGKKRANTLAFLKHCVKLTCDFWDVRAFFLLFCLALVGQSEESINGILETSYSLGWFNLNRPFCLSAPIRVRHKNGRPDRPGCEPNL